MCAYGYSVSPWELDLVRNKLKSTLMFGLDNSSQVCEDIGRQLLTHQRRIHPSEMMARIDDVDVNALRTCIHRYFIDRDHVSAAFGAIHEVGAYDYPFLRTCSHWRRY